MEVVAPVAAAVAVAKQARAEEIVTCVLPMATQSKRCHLCFTSWWWLKGCQLFVMVVLPSMLMIDEHFCSCIGNCAPLFLYPGWFWLRPLYNRIRSVARYLILFTRQDVLNKMLYNIKQKFLGDRLEPSFNLMILLFCFIKPYYWFVVSLNSISWVVGRLWRSQVYLRT